MHESILADFHKRLKRVEDVVKRSSIVPTVPKYDLAISTFLPPYLQLDCIGNNGDVERDFTSITGSFFFEYEVAFSPHLLSTFGVNNGEAVFELISSNFRSITFPQVGEIAIQLDVLSGDFKWRAYLTDSFFNPTSPIILATPTVTITPETWYTHKIHLNTTTSPMIFTAEVDGVSLTGPALTGMTMTDIQYLDLEGDGGADLSHDSLIYFRNFKMGTSLGASDLINDPFNTPPVDSTIWNSFIFNATIIT